MDIMPDEINSADSNNAVKPRNEKTLGWVVVALGIVALFFWFKYASFLPALNNPKSNPLPTQPVTQIEPTPADMGSQIYGNTPDNQIQQIPDTNPFKTSPSVSPSSYQNPFN